MSSVHRRDFWEGFKSKGRRKREAETSEQGSTCQAWKWWTDDSSFSEKCVSVSSPVITSFDKTIFSTFDFILPNGVRIIGKQANY